MIKKAVYLERAPAKINLFLEVLGKREDNYHDLNTLFQAIDLQDHLTFEIQVLCSPSEEIDFNIEIDSNSDELKNLGLNNSISKAVELYFTKLPVTQVIEVISAVEISVFVDKQIPLQAGLAGGSSDAAATLRALNRFFEENFDWCLSQHELLEVALEIGSDVPFCLLATQESRLHGAGRGEKLSKKTFKFNYDDYENLILVKPDFGVDTAWAYDQLDAQIEKETCKLNLGFSNSFEKVVFPKYPDLVFIKEKLEEFGCKRVLLSGSGSTMIGFLDKNQDQKAIFRQVDQFFPATYMKKMASFL